MAQLEPAPAPCQGCLCQEALSDATRSGRAAPSPPPGTLSHWFLSPHFCNINPGSRGFCVLEQEDGGLQISAPAIRPPTCPPTHSSPALCQQAWFGHLQEEAAAGTSPPT